MEVFHQLSEEERKIILSSLPILSKNMEFFVLRFYYHFLMTKAGLLFQHTKIETQHKMFSTALNAIITQIADPALLEHTIDELVKTHSEYGIVQEHIDYFINSFMAALQEVFNEDSDALLNTWHKVIVELMSYFRNV